MFEAGVSIGEDVAPTNDAPSPIRFYRQILRDPPLDVAFDPPARRRDSGRLGHDQVLTFAGNGSDRSVESHDVSGCDRFYLNLHATARDRCG